MANCPHCGKPLPVQRGKRTYTPEFLEFWQAYDAAKLCPNASKSDAFKAWEQIEDDRPDQAILLAALRLYKAYLTSGRSNPIPACHPAVFLRQKRYEGFLDRVRESVPAAVPSVDPAMWDGYAVRIAGVIGEGAFQAWFADGSFDPGPPPTIRQAKDFKRNWIEKKFSRQLASVLGEFRLLP